MITPNRFVVVTPALNDHVQTERLENAVAVGSFEEKSVPSFEEDTVKNLEL